MIFSDSDYSSNHQRSSCKKNFDVALLFVDFSEAFDSIHRGKMKHRLLACNLQGEIVITVMMRYKNMKAMVRSPDGDTDFFEIVTRLFQGDTSAPYLSIICVDYYYERQ